MNYRSALKEGSEERRSGIVSESRELMSCKDRKKRICSGVVNKKKQSLERHSAGKVSKGNTVKMYESMNRTDGIRVIT